MKRGRSIFGALLLVLCAAVLAVLPVRADSLGDLIYEIQDGQVTITDCCDYLEGELTVPDTIEGYPVTALGYGAFAKCDYSRITLPEGLVTIGDGAFRDCKNLREMTIPEGVVTIGQRAFQGCAALTRVTMPDSVTELGEIAFYECSGLREITLSRRLTAIMDSTFHRCTALTGITVPGSVTVIDREAFYQCTALETITLSEGVESIGYMAFCGCSALKAVHIPASVTNLERSVFGACSALKELTVAAGNAAYASDDRGVLFNKEKTTLIMAIPTFKGDYEIPDSVTTIGVDAFEGCVGLTGIRIPEGVTVIEGRAFMGCSGLEEVTIPQGVTGIGYCAFEECTGLTQVTIPQSVVTIEHSAFEGCSGLRQVYIPSGVTTIEYRAFDFCDSLTGFTVAQNNPSYSSDDQGVLFDKAKTRLIRAPMQLAGAYTVPDSVTVIGDSAFYCCRELLEVSLPASLICIEDYAFGYCELLGYVNLRPGTAGVPTQPEQSYLGEASFYQCRNLIQITLPQSVSRIEGEAFAGCESLTGLTLPAGFTEFEYEVFRGCISLERVVFTGDAPIFMDNPETLEGVFENLKLKACYPAGNPTWIREVRQDYGGRITWEAVHFQEPAEALSDQILDDDGVTFVATSGAPTEEGTEPSEPSEAPTENGTEPSEPSEVPTENGTEPSEPSEVPTENGTEPTEPREVPTENGTEPSEYNEVPTENGTEPSELSEAPTENGTEPLKCGEQLPDTDDRAGDGFAIVILCVMAVMAGSVTVLFIGKKK